MWYHKDGDNMNSKDLKEFKWLNLSNPSEKKLKELSDTYAFDYNDLIKATDKFETPHIDINGNVTTYVFKMPYVIETSDNKKYRSYPVSLFLNGNVLLSISLNEHPLIDELKANENIDITNPVIWIMKSTEYFIKYLNEIQEDILEKEKTLIKSTSNKDLEHMLTLQKSLLYFTTALQGNRSLLEKIKKIDNFSNNETELIIDAELEINQAIEMANIYREILESTMDTYSSIISNNLNDVMKFLTSVTLVISIPTMISSFLGMNLSLGEFGTNPFSFLLIVLISFLVAIILILVLKKKNLL